MKRVFIAFAVEDKSKRDFVVGQSKLERSPFEFADFSVKEPWSQSWKTSCRTRIRGCDGVIALISRNTAKADGQLWEIQCGYDEERPVMLMWVSDERPPLPNVLKNKLINIWSWSNLKAFMNKL